MSEEACAGADQRAWNAFVGVSCDSDQNAWLERRAWKGDEDSRGVWMTGLAERVVRAVRVEYGLRFGLGKEFDLDQRKLGCKFAISLDKPRQILRAGPLPGRTCTTAHWLHMRLYQTFALAKWKMVPRQRAVGGCKVPEPSAYGRRSATRPVSLPAGQSAPGAHR
jgi:hypothetical protein